MLPPLDATLRVSRRRHAYYDAAAIAMPFIEREVCLARPPPSPVHCSPAAALF